MIKKNFLAIIALFLLSSNALFAVDHIVQQGGPVGTYTSITAAITAAVDGDNIVINNRADGLPWLESITINKSLTFVSAVDNVQWWMEGNIIVNMAEGRVITIVGMRNTSGGITRTGTAPTNRTVLNILSSDLNGNIVMGSGINLYLGSSKALDVSYTFGKIYGNDLRGLYLSSDGTSSEDVNQIIGNRIGIHTTASTAVSLSSNTQYVYYSNNYSRGSSVACGVNSLKSGATINRIINSTIASSSISSLSSNNTGLYVGHTSGNLTVESCMLAGYSNTISSGGSGVVISSSSASLTTCTYNLYYNPYSSIGYGTALNSALNNTSISSSVSISADGIISGTAHIDAGNPSNYYLDLDLSRNDIGVYGGSYSMSNFLPLMNNTESSRVNFMSTPRVVNQGGTVNVQVIGYDK